MEREEMIKLKREAWLKAKKDIKKEVGNIKKVFKDLKKDIKKNYNSKRKKRFKIHKEVK